MASYATGLKLYDVPWPGLQDPPTLEQRIAVERACYLANHSPAKGGLGKFGHFKNFLDLTWNNPACGSKVQFLNSSWSDRFFETACKHQFVAVAGAASTGKSHPAALWAVANFAMDPTHTLIIVMSTTIAGAKQRVWKSLLGYYRALPGLPGRLLESTNRIRGVNYEGTGFTDGAGIVLMAGEPSAAVKSTDRLIGIKAPATDGPNGRIGKLIIIIDEATGVSEAILTAIKSNLAKNANFQAIFLANPDSKFDTFGQVAKPLDGWDSISVDSEEWPIDRGMCLHYDALKSPRIVDGRDDLFWMPTREMIEADAITYGRDSKAFFRMCRGFWIADDMSSTVYSEAELLPALERITWGLSEPTKIAFLDPSFTEGGDRAILYVGSYGISTAGIPTLQFDFYETLKPVADKEVPFTFALARLFRDRCKFHGVAPHHAALDATGAGTPFLHVVHSEWSPAVTPIHFAGVASERPISKTDPTPASQRYQNKVTEIWLNAKPLLAGSHIKGLSTEAAMEISKREYTKSTHDVRRLCVESKRIMKSRTGSSPDLGDAAFGLVEFCRTKFGFRAGANSAPQQVFLGEPVKAPTVSSFAKFAKRVKLSGLRLQ